MRLRYHTLDVFTDRPGGGNRLAVFPDAPALPSTEMQRIARELGFSETVFVRPATGVGAVRRLRIFTPAVELPFAGHPTIGAAHLLASLGAIPLPVDAPADASVGAGEASVLLEEGIGPVPVTVRFAHGRPVFARLTAVGRPEERAAPPHEAIAALLSLHPDDVRTDRWAPAAASAGVPYLLVPVRDVATLGRARLDRGTWERELAGAWAPHVYVFAVDADGVAFRARMFAPALEIDEDPATGAAAAALAGYLARREIVAGGTIRRTIRQGIEMGRPSTLEIEADVAEGEIVVRVGGASVPVGDGEEEIDSMMDVTQSIPPAARPAHI